jgi:hypothetical protein
MPLTTQVSDRQQTPAAGNTASNSKIPKPGILDGRTVAPCKSTRCLTDMQIRKVGIIALAIILSLAPILAGALIGGAAAIPFGVMFGVLGVLGGIALSLSQWPRADFQTSEGAKTILNDLKTMSLTELHSNYNFSDLAKYGYISKEDANTMQHLYKQMPSYEVVRDGNTINSYATYCVNKVNGVHEQRQRIEHQFNAVRWSPGFGTWN